MYFRFPIIILALTISSVLSTRTSWSYSKVNPGVVILDSYSFNKTIEAFPFSLIKFDTFDPSEDSKHESFGILAKELTEQPKILIAEVRIRGYGHPENHDLGERFGLNQGMLPELMLFAKKKSPGKKIEFQVTRYGDEVDLDHLRRFLQVKTGIWIGLPGCIKEFDELANMFARNSGKDLDKILEQTQIAIDKAEPEAAAVGKKYLKIMKLIKADDSFLIKEEDRIANLLKKSKMSPEKRDDLQKTLNILKSFHFKPVSRDEL